MRDAIKEFRGIEISDKKCQEFEEKVCRDAFMINSDLAAKRILEVVEKTKD